MAKKNISRKGKNRASKFNEAHRLTTLKEENNVLVKAINESDPKRRLSRSFCKFTRVRTKSKNRFDLVRTFCGIPNLKKKEICSTLKN